MTDSHIQGMYFSLQINVHASKAHRKVDTAIHCTMQSCICATVLVCTHNNGRIAVVSTILENV